MQAEGSCRAGDPAEIDQIASGLQLRARYKFAREADAQ